MSNSMESMMGKAWKAVLTAGLAAGVVLWGASGVRATTPEEREAQVGKEAAAEVEKEYKLAKEPDQAKRVADIANAIAPSSPRAKVTYTCKVLDTLDVNAFSLPGGYIYVTRGLLAAVESDDELAAVLAHEIGHNCKKHGMVLMQKQAKIDKRLTLATLAAVLAGGAVNPYDIAVAGSLLKTSILNGYSRKDEYEADQEAVLYLQKTGKWNPVAMLSVLEGLARMESTRPERDLGIFQTHPYAAERAGKTREQLVALGIAPNLRTVVSSMVPSAKAVEVNGQQIGQVSIDERVIFQPAVSSGGAGPVERAQQMAAALKEMLGAGLKVVELGKKEQGDGFAVNARGRTLIEMLAGDAKFHGVTPGQQADKVMESLRYAFWVEKTRRAY